MPSRKPPLDDRSEWTVNLTPGPHCSIGCSTNEAMSYDGTTSTGRQNEDRYYTCIYQSQIQLYMVLDGHDGMKAVKFAQTFIPHLLLQSELMGGDARVQRAIRDAVVKTEQEFFISIDPHITRKVTLQLEMEQKAPDADSSIALKLFPSQISEIGRLDELIKGGTTVVVALIYNDILYVANIGDSRALLCSQNPDGSLKSVEQISVDHNTSNQEELLRLAGCGLDPSELMRAKRLGTQQNTRSIGDYSIKGGYTNVDIISHANREPGTAEPYLHKSIPISSFNGFLILMSDGLYEAYEAWTGRPERINEDIAHLVVKELTGDNFEMAAQKVVDKVKVLYRDTCKVNNRYGRLDDITLVVRTIGRASLMYMRSESSNVSPHRVHQPQGPVPSSAPPTSTNQFDFGIRGNFTTQQSMPRPPLARNEDPQQFWSHAPYPTGGGGRGPSYGTGAFPQQPDMSGYQPQQPYLPHQQMWPYYPDQRYHSGQQPSMQYPRAAAPNDPQGSYRPRGNYPEPSNYQERPSNYRPFQVAFPHQQQQRHVVPDSEQKNQPPHEPHPQPLRSKNTPNAAQQVYTPPAKTESSQEVVPPPVPPRTRQGSHDDPNEMYGWSGEKKPSHHPSPSKVAPADNGLQTLNPQTLKEVSAESPRKEPQTLAKELPTLAKEPPTLSKEPLTLAKEPQALNMEPQTLKEEPQTLEEEPGTLNEEPRTLNEDHDDGGTGGDDGPKSEKADYLFYNEDRNDLSSEEDEAPDGSGAIKPYIRFTDQFPVDLSWGDIKIDP